MRSPSQPPPPGVGKVYIQTVLNCFSRYVWARLYTSKMPVLEKKRLRWFREDGRHLGTVLSKDPIRRVYTTGEGMVVESRQRLVLLEGVPTWWE